MARRAFLGLVALSLFYVGCAKRSEQKSPAKAPAAKVTVAHPLRLPIVEWDAYIGRLEAVDSVDIRARVSGYLQAHYFQEGTLVQAGDPLFLIDPRPFEAAMAESKAALAEAQAAIVEADARRQQSVAEREQVSAKLVLADKQLERARRLVPQGAVSEDEFDILTSERQQAVADLAAADAAIASAQARAAAARAAVDSAAAAVESSALDLSFTKIYAPISGRISRRYATKGNLIMGGALGATLLTTIVSIDPIHCNFDANERELLKYTRLDRSGARESSRNVKNPVYMSLVDEKGFPHQGHMDFVDNRVDANTGTMRGRAIFPNKDQVLAPGMFADIRLPGSGRYEAILIPDAAVGIDQSEQFVFVIGEQNLASRRAVELGPMVHGLRVVRSGLTADDLIVTRGLQRAREGAVVQPSEETIKPAEGEGLPDQYTPIPKEEWLTPAPMSAVVEQRSFAQEASLE